MSLGTGTKKGWRDPPVQVGIIVLLVKPWTKCYDGKTKAVGERGRIIRMW